MTKRVAIILSIIAFLTLVIFLALGNNRVFGALQQQSQNQVEPSASPEAALLTTARSVVTRNDQVTAACKLIPINFVDLSFNTSGLVSEVFIKEGQQIGKGDLLAQLSDQAQARAAVSTAELELTNAQFALKLLYDEAPLNAAEALQALANAPEAVAEAEDKITGLQRGTFNQADVDAAEANLIFAESKLKDAQDAYRPYSNKNENNLVRAKLLSDLSQAQKDYEVALRKYNAYFGTPSETTISKAEADLALARAQQEEAQRKYEILRNGPDPDDVTLTQARIANAEAQLAAAQASLDKMELRAPFTGTVGTINMKPGEYVAPGIQVLLLIDESDWKVETTDLTELNVVNIVPGAPAEIVFDAIPSQKFQGNVNTISAQGENRQGDIVYRVTSDIKNLDPRLKWNMTCSIVIKKP